MGIKTGELVSFVFGFFNLDMIVLEYLKVFLEINWFNIVILKSIFLEVCFWFFKL